MSHSHDHGPASASNTKRLVAALLLAASYMMAEVIGGLYTGSLALLADAGHMLSDVAALALALVAMWLARRPAPASRTFGNHRAEVLAALANSVALAVIGIFVIVEAVERWSSPPEVLAGPMLLIATGGLVVNVVALLILRGGQKESLNVRGAFLHVMADALGSVGAMTSGILILLFDWRWADPLASLVIAALVLFSAVMLLRQTLAVLMQSAPAGLDLEAVKQAMVKEGGLSDVHDLHAWTLTSGKDLLTAHIVLDDDGAWRPAIERLTALLRDEFQVAHVTLQPELPSEADCHCAFA